jgi:YhcH/YjgK/YiaL family protein
MIFDTIMNAHLYLRLSPSLAHVFDYIAATDMPSLAAGRHDIDGCDVFVLISDYSTRTESQGTWEAHRRFIDLHYIINGTERIGFAPISRMKPGAYDQAKDFLAIEGTGDFLTLRKGDFMLLFPDDAHMPSLAGGNDPTPVKKAVFKIPFAPFS